MLSGMPAVEDVVVTLRCDFAPLVAALRSLAEQIEQHPTPDADAPGVHVGVPRETEETRHAFDQARALTLLHEADGLLGLALHRHEADTARWRADAEALVLQIRLFAKHG